MWTCQKGGVKEKICEKVENNMYHKSSPLFHMKVPKTEPILQLLKFSFINST
jgi:hypothetical protein